MAALEQKLAELTTTDSSKKEKAPKNSAKMAPKKKESKKTEGAALIGIDVKKEVDLAEWYQQVLTKANLIAFYDVSGCYILKPWSYYIWERIRDYFDERIQSIGVENCYFPIFISQDNLQREKDHIEGFAAEVAWVTKGGKSDLEKPVAVRPTSETAMYNEFSREIRSHRDLPLKLNQWNNVVRWEFKHPMPFLRSREFLWQEGHTAHLTAEEARKEVLQILDWYRDIYSELLAVPMVLGTKTTAEKFPGAEYTTTVEGFIPATGRGIQGATSHCLGTHFSKMFDIKVEDPEAKKTGKSGHVYVWQNSWGFTTRSIGVMILTHGDNKGLILPPRVARIQVVVVPVGITAKTTDEQRAKLEQGVESIARTLREAKVRVHVDDREGYSPPWKFNDWELKGVPLRIEFGPKDAEKDVVTYSRRDVEGKATIPIDDLASQIPALLDTIHNDLYKKADDEYRAHRKIITNFDEAVPSLNAKNVILIPHCEGEACEDQIKEMTARKDDGDSVAEDARAPAMGAKSLCIPFEQPEGIEQGKTKCLNPKCDQLAKSFVMFGRSY